MNQMHPIETLEPRRLLAGDFGLAFTLGEIDVTVSPSAVAVDAAGDTYLAGTFNGKVDFAPGSAIQNLTSRSESDDIFLAKYSGRTLLWVRQIGGTGNDAAGQLKLGPSGELYLTGSFTEAMPLRGVDGPFSLTSHGDSDGFVVKMDGRGRVIWGGNVGGNRDDSVTAIDVGPNGDVYLAGTIRLEGDVDPTGRTRRITTRGVDDTFVERLSGSNGRLKWVRVYGENDTFEEVYGLVADGYGGVFAVGSFLRSVQFKRGSSAFTRESQGGLDLYVGRLSGQGDWVFLSTVGGDDDQTVVDVAQGPGGNLYLTGNTAGLANFGTAANPLTITSIGESDAYVAKVRRDGRFAFVRQFGGADAQITASAIALDADENIYSTGQFTETADFNPAAGTFNLSIEKDEATQVPGQPYTADVYISKLNARGRFAYAQQLGGPDGSMLAAALTATPAGDVYLTGNFTGTVDVAPGTENRLLKSPEDADSEGYLVKLLG